MPQKPGLDGRPARFRAKQLEIGKPPNYSFTRADAQLGTSVDFSRKWPDGRPKRIL